MSHKGKLANLSLRELLKERAKLQARLGRRQMDSFHSQGVMTSDPRLEERLRLVNEEIEGRGGADLHREAAHRLLADWRPHVLRQTAGTPPVQNGDDLGRNVEAKATEAASSDTVSPAENNDKTAQSVESKPTEPTCWTEIDIAFLSDERVEIWDGNSRKTYNYAELGFEDRRTGKPNSAWEILRGMASTSGTIPRPSPGKGKATIQKRIEEIREKLRDHFIIQTDPIPFDGNTYQASFKISRRPSSDT